MLRPHRFTFFAAVSGLLLFTQSLSLETGGPGEGPAITASGEVPLTFYYQRKDTRMVCLDGEPFP